MGKGQAWKDPVFRYEDGRSGRVVTRLTDSRGHCNHLYCTDPCWCDGGRSFIFTSDRDNQSNLFRYDLADAAITQLTDLHGRGRPGGAYCAATGRHDFWWQGELCELDPGTLDLRALPGAAGDGPQRAVLADGGPAAAHLSPGSHPAPGGGRDAAAHPELEPAHRRGQ